MRGFNIFHKFRVLNCRNSNFGQLFFMQYFSLKICLKSKLDLPKCIECPQNDFIKTPKVNTTSHGWETYTESPKNISPFHYNDFAKFSTA